MRQALAHRLRAYAAWADEAPARAAGVAFRAAAPLGLPTAAAAAIVAWQVATLDLMPKRVVARRLSMLAIAMIIGGIGWLTAMWLWLELGRVRAISVEMSSRWMVDRSLLTDLDVHQAICGMRQCPTRVAAAARIARRLREC